MTAEQVIATLIAQYRPDGPGAAMAPTDEAAVAPADAPAATNKHSEHPAETGSDPTGAGGNGCGGAGSAPAGAGSDPTGAGGNGRGGAGAAAPGDHGPAGPAAPVGAPGGGGCGAQVGIEVRVALSTLLGRDEQPGEIPGLGLLPAPEARARVALQGRAQWRFAVTDTDGQLVSEGVTRCRPGAVGAHPVRRDGPSGGIVELHIPITMLTELMTGGPAASGQWTATITDIAAQHTRRDSHLADLDAHPGDRLPGAALRRHTEIRDRTCTFPGCRRPAHTCEADHTRDHAAGGATTSANTGPVCDHDHDVKHRGGWRLTQPEPGEFVWRSPLGGEYRTHGEFLLPPMPDPHPVDLGPHFDQPTARIEGPILQPYRPVEPPRPPPLAPALPDEPPF